MTGAERDPAKTAPAPDGPAPPEIPNALAGRLARALPPVPPPPALLDAALARVRTAGPRSPWAVTARADGGACRPFAPGVTAKLLWADRATGRRVALLRVAPGATCPARAHPPATSPKGRLLCISGAI